MLHFQIIIVLYCISPAQYDFSKEWIFEDAMNRFFFIHVMKCNILFEADPRHLSQKGYELINL